MVGCWKLIRWLQPEQRNRTKAVQDGRGTWTNGPLVLNCLLHYTAETLLGFTEEQCCGTEEGTPSEVLILSISVLRIRGTTFFFLFFVFFYLFSWFTCLVVCLWVAKEDMRMSWVCQRDCQRLEFSSSVLDLCQWKALWVIQTAFFSPQVTEWTRWFMHYVSADSVRRFFSFKWLF